MEIKVEVTAHCDSEMEQVLVRVAGGSTRFLQDGEKRAFYAFDEEEVVVRRAEKTVPAEPTQG